MSNNKQQTAVEKLYLKFATCSLEEMVGNINVWFDQAKEMEVMGKEMSYADGYKEGYKRALEMIEWYIKNHISGMPQDHIGDTNKKVDE